MKSTVQGTLVLASMLLSTGAAFPDQQSGARDETTKVYAGEPLQAPGASRAPEPQGAVIFDNGPIITHPTGGSGGLAASALQTSMAMTIFGFGHQMSAGNRVADDFTVPVGETWTIDTVTFFAYQTGSGTTSSINNVNVQIWNGIPNDPGSVVVFGDTTTNRLASSTFFNTFRVLDTTLTDTNRPVMMNEITIGTTLTAGTYWLDWTTGGSASFSGPWVPPVTILGQTTTGNAKQKIGAAAWVDLVDVGPQGLPFILNGPDLVTVAPFANSVDAAGNGVFQPNETVAMAPTWTNTGSSAVSLTGALSAFTGPAGPTYTIGDAAASYGTIAPAANQICTDCYGLTIAAATRPAAHWDSTVLETVNPSATTKTWTLHIGDTFTDVTGGGFYRFIETIVHRGVTGGCTATTYCPSASTTRDQMAVFVLVAREGAGYTPPACTTPMFTDVPASSPFCRFIEELARRGVVGGCGGTNYCPTAPATREQMAVFVLRTLDPALAPPVCTTPMFTDVPASSPFCRWIEELARRGVVTGCGGTNYCPTAPVSREQMSVFLAATFGLVLYGL